MFFLLPLVVSACLGFGLKYFQLETDTEYLVTPKNGEAKAERRVSVGHGAVEVSTEVEPLWCRHPTPFYVSCEGSTASHFLVEGIAVDQCKNKLTNLLQVILENFDLNQTHEFLPERGAVLDGFLDVIIASPDGGHVLTPSKIAAIHKLDDFIRNIWAKVRVLPRCSTLRNVVRERVDSKWHESTCVSVRVLFQDDIKVPYTYESICGLWQKKCSPQILLEIYSNASLADQVPLTYPWFGNHFLGSVFGELFSTHFWGPVGWV